jgi:hypothetical protein
LKYVCEQKLLYSEIHISAKSIVLSDSGKMPLSVLHQLHQNPVDDLLSELCLLHRLHTCSDKIIDLTIIASCTNLSDGIGEEETKNLFLHTLQVIIVLNNLFGTRSNVLQKLQLISLLLLILITRNR